MRRLIARARREERGAVSIIVAVGMLALLGFVAVAVDIGALYAERAELQSGADAAALAVAQDCADGSCTGTAATAQTLANANARDGATNIVSLTSPTPHSVRVTTGTREGGSNAGALAFVFAPVLGIDSASPRATATAGWGSPAAGPAVLPITFAPCVFKLDGPIQVISMHGDSGGTSCSSTSPSGQLLPGGFGWLAAPAGTCNTRADIAVNAPMSSDTGSSLPSGCSAVLAANAGRTVLLPVYSDLGGTGSGGWYKIRGWAAFQLLGWNFPGDNRNNTSYTGAKCTGSCKGIIGKFVSFVSLDDRFTRGGPDLGTALVSLTQ
jgi:Flp pilus assembly protein TadG